MMPFALVLAGSSLFLTVADAVPKYDVRPTCRAAIEMMGSQGRTVDSCMASETAARDEIAKIGRVFPMTRKRDACRQLFRLGRQAMSSFSSASR